MRIPKCPRTPRTQVMKKSAQKRESFHPALKNAQGSDQGEEARLSRCTAQRQGAQHSIKVHSTASRCTAQHQVKELDQETAWFVPWEWHGVRFKHQLLQPLTSLCSLILYPPESSPPPHSSPLWTRTLRLEEGTYCFVTQPAGLEQNSWYLQTLCAALTL